MDLDWNPRPDKHRKRKAATMEVDEPDSKRPGSRKSGMYGVLDS